MERSNTYSSAEVKGRRESRAAHVVVLPRGIDTTLKHEK